VHARFREGVRLRGRDHLKDLGVGGRIILKWNLDIRREFAECIKLAQSTAIWQGFCKCRNKVAENKNNKTAFWGGGIFLIVYN